jgi:hypothetical protein
LLASLEFCGQRLRSILSDTHVACKYNKCATSPACLGRFDLSQTMRERRITQQFSAVRSS